MTLAAQIATDISEVFINTNDFAQSFTYSRGTISGTVAFIRDDSSIVTDNARGMITEVAVVEFVGKQSALGSFGDPQKFDRITDGTDVFEVHPLNDKCFYLNSGLIHIHAKQVHA